MEATERFAALMDGPDDEMALDEACLLIAAHFTTALDVDAELARIDALAAGVDDPTRAGVLTHLFGRLRFRGDVDHYADPENSFLNRVLDRRTGIPITLSVLTVEVARRVGVPLVGVGFPGHFLVRDLAEPDVFVDPFSGGVELGADGCRALFAHQHGSDAAFDPAYLRPTPARAVVARVLANLRQVFAAAEAAFGLATTLRLRALIPGVPVGERRELAQAYAALGRFAEAATELEAVAEAAGADDADRLRSAARHLRAKLN